jgi:hypothetical protein
LVRGSARARGAGGRPGLGGATRPPADYAELNRLLLHELAKRQDEVAARHLGTAGQQRGADSPQDALTAAEHSIERAEVYEDGLARGLALLAASRRAEGLRALRAGLLLLPDRNRAKQIIITNLGPIDP